MADDAPKKLTPEQQAILDEANSRPSLIEGHPDLKNVAQPTEVKPVLPRSIYYPDGKPQDDPRTFGAQKSKQNISGYGNGNPEGTVDDPDWHKKFGSGGSKGV